MKPYPEINELFELSFDGRTHNVQPLVMVARCGYDLTGWQYRGNPVLERQTHLFKFATYDRSLGREELLARLAKEGKFTEGQWLDAFKTAFPEHDGKGKIGVLDQSWVHPDSTLMFPCINYDGKLAFDWATFGLNDLWRWLVKVK